MAQSTNEKLLAATVIPLLFVGVGLLLLPVLLEVLWLDDEDVEDDEVEDDEDDLDDVACNLALLVVDFMVEFVVEFVPDNVMFAMLPVPIVELVLDPVVVELPGEPRAPVELLLDLGPGATIGVPTLPFEPEEAVEEVEETVAEPVEDFEVEARAAAASVGQVEQP